MSLLSAAYSPTQAWFRRAPVAAAVAAALLASATAAAQNLPNQSNNRFNYGSRIGQAELPAGRTFEPRVDAALQYANNTGLASDGGESALGLEVSPGLYAAYNTPRLVGAIDYSLIGRLWSDGDLDDITHALEANGRWEALRDLLFVDGDASYDDTVINYADGRNYGDLGVFNSGNLKEQATFSLGPTLRKRFKDFQFEASYRYGRVWILDEGKGTPNQTFGTELTAQDSEDQDASVSFGLVPGNSKVSGKFFYTWQHSDFEFSLPYEFERAGFDGGWEMTRTLTVIGDVGKESALDVSSSDGGLDSDFWSAGLRWSPNQRTSAEAKAGDRFFGDSYFANVTHSSRFAQFSATYEDAPNVDTSRRSLGQFDPGELPPGLEDGLNYSGFNSLPYVGKTSTVAVTSKGLRTFLSLSVNYVERDYLSDFAGDEQGSGVNFLGTRQLASNVSVDLQASYYDYEKADALIPDPFRPLFASHDYDTEFTLRGNRDFGPQLIGSLEMGFFNRSGTSEYDGWWVGLRGRWLPDLGK